MTALAPHEAPCVFCQKPLNPDDPTVWHRVRGWERKAPTQGTRKGGSDITLREARDEFACDGCIWRQKHHLNANQEALI